MVVPLDMFLIPSTPAMIPRRNRQTGRNIAAPLTRSSQSPEIDQTGPPGMTPLPCPLSGRDADVMAALI